MSDLYLDIKTVASDNIQLLRELSQLTQKLSQDAYSVNNESLQSGSVGAHVRHIIEHYISVLKNNVMVNYDDRQRNKELELIPASARAELDRICCELELVTTDSPLQVMCSTISELDPPPAASSLSRELSFLHSHTTHHMAIIRLLSLNLGILVSPEFGKAASTKKFEKNV